MGEAITNKIVCTNFAYAGAFKDVIAKGVEGRAASAVRFGGGGKRGRQSFRRIALENSQLARRFEGRLRHIPMRG